MKNRANIWMPLVACTLLSPSLARAQGTVGLGTGPTEVPPPGAGAPTVGAQGSFTPPSPIRPGVPVTVLVFPIGFVAEGGAAPAPAAPGEPAPEGGAPPAPVAGSTLTPEQREASAYLTAAVKAGLLSSPMFSVATYHPQSSLIQRAKKDDILRQEHLDGLVSESGAVDPEKARTVAYRLGVQTILVGSMEMTADAKANSVEITVDAQLIDTTTGKPFRSAAVSGAAAGAAGVSQVLIQERAAQEAAMKIFPALGLQFVGPAAPKAEKPSASDRRKEEAAARAAERDAQAKAREADRAAKKAAAEAKKSNDARKAPVKKQDGADAAKPAGGSRTAGLSVQPDESTDSQAPAAGTPAAAAAAAPAPPSGPVVQGVANAAGQPVPYGYAIAPDQGLPKRSRAGLRIPAWIGVAAFLTGVNWFLR